LQLAVYKTDLKRIYSFVVILVIVLTRKTGSGNKLPKIKFQVYLP